MPREVQGGDGVRWTCVQAFAGLGNDPEKRAAARVDDAEGGGARFAVVCTPSGASKSVRLELPRDWEGWPDERLLAAIQEGLAEQG
jgi:hypothetical protein